MSAFGNFEQYDYVNQMAQETILIAMHSSSPGTLFIPRESIHCHQVMHINQGATKPLHEVP